MERDEVKRLEAAVRSANPVPYPDDVASTEQAAALTLLVDQGRHTMTGTTPLPAPDPGEPSPRRRRRAALAFATGVVVTLVAGGAVLLLTQDEPTAGRTTATAPTETSAPAPTTTMGTTAAPVPTTTPAPAPTDRIAAPAYSWSGGVLSVWVTAEEVTAELRDLSRRYHGTDLTGEAVYRPTGGDLVWVAGDWSITVHAGGGYHSTPNLTDPRLPQGARYVGMGNSYVFSGPHSPTGLDGSPQAICITITTPGTTTVDGEPVLDGEPDYEDIMFEIGTFFLLEMGWAG